MTAANRLTVKGQVTVPVDIRRELGLRPGDRVAFVRRDGAVHIQRAAARDDVAELDRWLTSVKGTADLGGLSVDQWLDETRRRV